MDYVTKGVSNMEIASSRNPASSRFAAYAYFIQSGLSWDFVLHMIIVMDLCETPFKLLNYWSYWNLKFLTAEKIWFKKNIFLWLAL
jgi:hypothetical protein